MKNEHIQSVNVKREKPRGETESNDNSIMEINDEDYEQMERYHSNRA